MRRSSPSPPLDQETGTRHQSGIDLSPLTWRDAAQIALQRTDHLLRLPGLGSPSYRLWRRDRPGLLLAEAWLRRRAILAGAAADIQAEFAALERFLGERRIERMVDIGCGHALIDVLFHRRYGCELHLVDIERSDTHRHDYHESGSGYASLRAARDLLVANGVPAERVRTTNPDREPLADRGCDLVLSLLSCGFHYPVRTYAAFAREALKPGGLFLVDLREGTGQEQDLAEAGFAQILTVAEAPKRRRVAAVR